MNADRHKWHIIIDRCLFYNAISGCSVTTRGTTRTNSDYNGTYNALLLIQQFAVL